MAWNEPGGSGNNQDPWGGGNRNDQGPPDLDEALRKLQQKLGGLFGGGRRSGGGGSSGGGSNLPGALGVGLVAVVALVVWAAMGFYTVDAQQRSVVLRLGKFHELVGPGLRWNPPLIDQRYLVNVTQVRSKDHSALMLTEDENIVDVAVKVQYRVSDPQAFVLNVREPETSLSHGLESALRHAVGTSEMHSVITEGRAMLAGEVKEFLQGFMNKYGTGLHISKINVESARPPTQVQSAFDDVIKAREDQQREINQAEAYANGIIPEARGQAQRVREEANAYEEQVVAKAQGESSRFVQVLAEYQKTPGVMRERLYIDAIEGVMQRSTKVLMDVEGGNNIMYLPLDRIVGGASARLDEDISVQDGDGSSSRSSVSAQQIADEVLRRLRRQQSGREMR